MSNFNMTFDPVSLGVNTIVGALGVVGDMQAQRQAEKHAKEQLKFQREAEWSRHKERVADIHDSNFFRAQQKIAQRDIAYNRLLPQISRSVNTAWNSIAQQGWEADQADSYLRDSIRRRMFEIQGSGGSANEGNRSANFDRAIALEGAKASDAMRQLGEKGQARNRREALMREAEANKASQARENILAPLDMPVYMERVPQFQATKMSIPGIGGMGANIAGKLFGAVGSAFSSELKFG